jgi:hypothetical protein
MKGIHPAVHPMGAAAHKVPLMDEEAVVRLLAAAEVLLPEEDS